MAVSKSQTSSENSSGFKDRSYRLAVQQDTGARFRRFSQDKKFMWLHIQGARALWSLGADLQMHRVCIIQVPECHQPFPLLSLAVFLRATYCIMYLRAHGLSRFCGHVHVTIVCTNVNSSVVRTFQLLSNT